MSQATPTRSAADRNLLFGILALQMEFITRDALIAAMHAWVLDKTKTLGQILQEQQALGADEHAALETLVQKHLRRHGNDLERSLAAVAAAGIVPHELRSLTDSDLGESLAHVLNFRPDELKTTEHRPEGEGGRYRDLKATEHRPEGEGGRYRVLRPHARGGLGEVFIALDCELHREVALKEINAVHADDSVSRGRFLQEAEITGNLEHPGIVPVYGLGRYADGRPFYAMRLIQGETLKDAIHKFHDAQAAGRDPGARSLALRALLTRFIAVCNAVAYAHDRGVLHRDLKPSNILLGKYGETLVVDWGLAKAIGRAEGSGGREVTLQPRSSEELAATQIGAALGTPAYMSPEQAAGQVDKLGPASDVYSLGATLYTLLTGRPPVTGRGMGEVLHKAQQGDWPPPRLVKRDVDEALDAVCRKALALRPAERYATPLALAADVEQWLAGEPVSAWREPRRVRLRRWLARRRTLVTSAAATVLVGVIGLAVSLVLMAAANERERQARKTAEDNEKIADDQRRLAEQRQIEVRRQRDEARRNLYVSQINLAQRAWEDSQPDRAVELLKEAMPQKGERDERGFEWYYLWNLCHSALFTFTLRLPRGAGKDTTHHFASVAYSPDGKYLAAGEYVGSVEGARVDVWDAATGKLLLSRHADAAAVSTLAFSPDSKRLATGGRGVPFEVKIWDVPTGKQSLSLTGHKGGVTKVAYSPNGRHLATASYDGIVRVWDTTSGQQLLCLTGRRPVTYYAVAFSPCGQRFVTAGRDAPVKVWNAATGKEIYTLRERPDDLASVAFSPDGTKLAAAGWPKNNKRGVAAYAEVVIWDAAKGKELQSLRGHTGGISAIAFSPDSRRLASASSDRSVKLWEVESSREIFTLKGHAHAVQAVGFSPDGTRLACAAGPTVMVWDATADQGLVARLETGNSVRSLEFSPDSRQLGAALLGRRPSRGAKVWETATGRERLAISGGPRGAYLIAFRPDSKQFGVFSPDEIRICDAITGSAISSWKNRPFVPSAAVSPDGRRLVTIRQGIGKPVPMKIWDADTGRLLFSLNGPVAVGALKVTFSPDGRLLAAGGEPYGKSGEVKVWDAASGRERLSLKHADRVGALVFSSDGRRLATALLEAKKVKVWDLDSGKERLTLKGHRYAVFSLAFSADGRRLASGGIDNTLKIWGAENGQELLSLSGHSASIHSLAFSPDGKCLGSGDNDGMVRVWAASAPTPEVLRRRRLYRAVEALVESLFSRLVRKSAVLDHLRRDPTLSEPLRKEALARADRYLQDPEALNTASRKVVRGAGADGAAYERALVEAEETCRLTPDNASYVDTLGVAQYRNRKYEQALKSLSLAAKLFAAQFKLDHPTTLAFLAMTQHQLGQGQNAQTTMSRVRQLMQQPRWANNVEAKAAIAEAEELLKKLTDKAR
jgi:WD40 repeat protein/serine/threonine protein kinase